MGGGGVKTILPQVFTVLGSTPLLFTVGYRMLINTEDEIKDWVNRTI